MKGKSLFKIGMKETFINHGLKEKNRGYLEKLTKGQIKENPYKCVSQIYRGQ